MSAAALLSVSPTGQLELRGNFCLAAPNHSGKAPPRMLPMLRSHWFPLSGLKQCQKLIWQSESPGLSRSRRGLASSVDTAEARARTRGKANNCGKNLFAEHEFVRTLEISTSSEGPWSLLPGGEGAAAGLFDDGVFHATVHPDLPPVTTLGELVRYPWRTNPAQQKRGTPASSDVPASTTDRKLPGSGIGAAWQVRTVAAQVRPLPAVCARMAERACEIESGGGGGSLLLVSGGHPLRGVPILGSLMPTNSEEMLRAGHRMRRRNQLPAGVQLWAVENPMAASVERLERKIEAGAEAIITQPPLLPDRFYDWWAGASARGLPAAVPIIIGVPVISSAANLAFWMRLTNAVGPEADAAVRSFQEGEARAGPGKAELACYRREYTLAMMRMVRQLSGAAGMHVMPVSPRGWREMVTLRDELIS